MAGALRALVRIRNAASTSPRWRRTENRLWLMEDVIALIDVRSALGVV
jgi:hypothetical protein